MAVYKMFRIAADDATVCKDDACYEGLDISSYDNTVRAIQWNGTSGVTELCDGTDYDTNTGEGSVSAESDFQVVVDAWTTADNARIAAEQADSDAWDAQ